MKNSIKLMLVIAIAIIASFAGQNAIAQDNNALRLSHIKLANKIGNTSFTEVIKNGRATYYRHQGWYLGATGAANFVQHNGGWALNPNATVLAGYEWNHWHAELRVGETQFSYLGEKKFGFQTDAGIYYDFMPMKDRKFNIYIGAFGGYQHIKFMYKIPCDDLTVLVPYKGNSLRAGLEIGANYRILRGTSAIGVYARGFTYSYNAGDIKYQPIAGEIGLKFQFGVGRKVKYN